MTEPPGDADRTRPFAEDAVDRSGRQDEPAESLRLGDVVEVRALLPEVLAALKALTCPEGILACSDVHVVGVGPAERVGALLGESVRASSRRDGDLLDRQLALDAVFGGEDPRPEPGDAVLSLPLLEDVVRCPDADGAVDDRRPSDGPRLDHGPERATAGDLRPPVVHEIAHATVRGERVVFGIAPRSCLDDRDLCAATGERHGGAGPSGA